MNLTDNEKQLRDLYGEDFMTNLEAARAASEKRQKVQDELSAAVAATAEKKREAEQKKAAANFEYELRNWFFSANPDADEKDFLRLRPQLRDKFLLARTR